MLYVNNVRRYYNIMKWLTASETPPEGDAPEDGPDDAADPLELVEADAPDDSA